MNISTNEILSLPNGLLKQINANDRTILVADIGGTKTRMALFSPDIPNIRVGICSTKEVSSINDAIKYYLSEIGYKNKTIDTIILGVAGKVRPEDSYVRMTNAQLEVDKQSVQEAFNSRKCFIMNDLEIATCCTKWLAPSENTKLLTSHSFGNKPENYTTIFGACSTGASAAVWLPGPAFDQQLCRGLASEIGHMTSVSLPAEQLKTIKNELNKPAHSVSYEDVLSGAGIVRLYRSFGGLQMTSPEEIMSSESDDDICQKAVSLWADLLGSFLRDVSLAYNADRILLLGSVIEKNIPVLEKYAEKIQSRLNGERGHILDSISIEVITLAHPALTGGFQLALSLDNQ